MRLSLVVCCLAVAALADDLASSEDEVKLEISLPNLKKDSKTKRTTFDKEVTIELSLPKYFRGRAGKEKVKQSQSGAENLNTTNEKWLDEKVKLDTLDVDSNKDEKCPYTVQDDMQSKQKPESDENLDEDEDKLGVDGLKDMISEEEDSSSSEDNQRANIRNRKNRKSFKPEKTTQSKQSLKNLKGWLSRQAKLQAELGENMNLEAQNLKKKGVELPNLAETNNINDVSEELAEEKEIMEELKDKLNIKKALSLPSVNLIEVDIDIPKSNPSFEDGEMREKLLKNGLIELKNKWLDQIPKLELDLDLEQMNSRNVKSNRIDDNKNQIKLPDVENTYATEENLEDTSEELQISKEKVTSKIKQTIPSKKSVGIEIAIPNFKRSIASRKIKSKLNGKDLVEFAQQLPSLELNTDLDDNINLEVIKEEWTDKNDDLHKMIDKISSKELKEKLSEKIEEDLDSLGSAERKDMPFTNEDIELDINIPNNRRKNAARNPQARLGKKDLLALRDKWLRNKLKSKADLVNLAELEDLAASWNSIKDGLLQNHMTDEMGDRWIENEDSENLNKNKDRNEDERPFPDHIELDVNIPFTRKSIIDIEESNQEDRELNMQQSELLNEMPTVEVDLVKVNIEDLKNKWAKRKNSLTKRAWDDDLKTFKKNWRNNKNNIQNSNDESENIELDKIPLPSLPGVDIETSDVTQFPIGDEVGRLWRSKQDLASLKSKWLEKKSKLEIEIDPESEMDVNDLNDRLASKKKEIDFRIDGFDTNALEAGLSLSEGEIREGNASEQVETEDSIPIKDEIDIEITLPRFEQSPNIDKLKIWQNKQDLHKLLLLKKKWSGKKGKPEMNHDVKEYNQEPIGDLKENWSNEEHDLKQLTKTLVSGNEQKQHCQDTEENVMLSIEPLSNKIVDGIFTNGQTDMEIDIPNARQSNSATSRKARQKRVDLKGLKRKWLNKNSKLVTGLDLSNEEVLEGIRNEMVGKTINLEQLANAEDLEDLKEKWSEVKLDNKNREFKNNLMGRWHHNKKHLDQMSEYINLEVISENLLDSNVDIDGMEISPSLETEEVLPSENTIDVQINIPSFKRFKGVGQVKPKHKRQDLADLKKWLGRNGKSGLIDLKKQLATENDSIEDETDNNQNEETEVAIPLEGFSGRSIEDILSLDVQIEIPTTKQSFDIKGEKENRNRPNFNLLKEKWSRNKSKPGFELTEDEPERLEDLKDVWGNNTKERKQRTKFEKLDALKEPSVDVQNFYKTLNSDEKDSPLSNNSVEITVPDFKHLRSIQKDKDSDNLYDYAKYKTKKAKKSNLLKLKQIIARTISQGKSTLENDLDTLEEELGEKIMMIKNKMN